jgi:hypothetical protein
MLRMEIEQETPAQREMKPMLEKIHQQIGPEDADSIVAINTDTGEFVLGADYGAAYRAFRDKFGNAGRYICRVDGSPAIQA